VETALMDDITPGSLE
jgi:hypothetical protein